MESNSKNQYEGVILALDIASRNTGYAIYKNGKIISSGVWKLKGGQHLQDLYTHITKAIESHKVTQLAAEDIYKDPDKKNAWERLAECRGVAILCNQQHQLADIAFIGSAFVCSELWNYNGYKTYYKRLGRDEKKQRTINYLIHNGYLPTGEKSDDRADAVALLLVWLQIHRYQPPTPTYNPKE